MILAIVGSRSLDGNKKAHKLIVDAIRMHKPDIVVSGGARGIDKMAVLMAENLGVQWEEITPKVWKWDGPGGIKERNQLVAARCDSLVAIVDPNSRTQGGRWTAEYARGIGKDVRIEEVFR